MATNVRVVMHGEVVGMFLRGDVGRLPAELNRRARNVARAAGREFAADGQKGKNRYRTTIRNTVRYPNARAALLPALDAARAE
jgi:hypothetical protein